MKQKYLITPILLLCVVTGYAQDIQELSFLAGTWKVEGKENYEVWNRTNKNELSGNSYTIKNGEKIISEYLSIQSIEGKLVYEARVLNQNEGQSIPFTLQPNTRNGYLFENKNHDFPTKIIYQKINDTELLVHVLGSDDKGFTLKMHKQP